MRSAVERALSGNPAMMSSYQPPGAELLAELDRIDDSLLTLAMLVGPDAVGAQPDLLIRVRGESFSGWSFAPRLSSAIRQRLAQTGDLDAAVPVVPEQAGPAHSPGALPEDTARGHRAAHPRARGRRRSRSNPRGDSRYPWRLVLTDGFLTNVLQAGSRNQGIVPRGAGSPEVTICRA